MQFKGKCIWAMTVFAVASIAGAAEPSVGGGTLDKPAIGPAPTYGAEKSKFTLVKNWDFGSSGTIKNIADLNAEFQYHDQFGTIGNGTNYGGVIVAPDAAHALAKQPIEDSLHPARQFTEESLRTNLVPLKGATTITPGKHNLGTGSFQAKWTLPAGGAHLAHDILWETRLRYDTPKYFWFSIWTAGNKWNHGAEMDVVESFGYDNGGANTNYAGKFWHANSVGGKDSDAYSSWPGSMTAHGVTDFDPTTYHIWSWLYRTDDTYSVLLDGVEVQHGILHWTLKGTPTGTPLNMSFIFDTGWGHTQVASVNHPLEASEFDGKYYEFDYSRVYLSPSAEPSK